MVTYLEAYAVAADRHERAERATNFGVYGGNAALVNLRCFKYYHPDQGSWLTAPDGRERWMGPKGSRIYAIVHRGNGTKTTMKAIAAEAMCCVSTVSRVLTRLQAYGFIATTVTKGRNGGVIVKLAQVVPAMRHYIEAAWKRIRSWINVASRSQGGEKERESTSMSMDATFSGVCSHTGDLDELRRMVLAGEYCAETPVRITQADRERSKAHDRAQDFARQVIAERRRLDEHEPDWDLYLEYVRSSHGLD